MTDIFHRAIDSLNPLLSSVSLKERERKNKKKPFSKEVLSLLDLPSTAEDENDLRCDSDDEEDIYNIELDEEENCI